MVSTFTWLDSSEHERRKMLDVIAMVGERTTRDELGLEAVRNAFADLLFPGTSTIQTTAKYFLLVPWIYQSLERKHTPSEKVVIRASKLEIDLVNELQLSGDPTRADHVRFAFNSPFWPFVLATTSVGQGGLDCHPYCHAVVHWNLPSNPVDLEQREGRVHRYKGHALRKNIAASFHSAARTETRDPWASMFDVTRSTRAEGENDLFPFWIAPDGVAKIERHVPAFPHSREVVQHANLRRSLDLYRMVFGQNRQEDLIEYLLSRLPPEEVERVVERCRIDLSPPMANSIDRIQTGLSSTR